MTGTPLPVRLKIKLLVNTKCNDTLGNWKLTNMTYQIPTHANQVHFRQLSYV